MGCSLRKPTTSLDAYDLYMRGLAAFRNLSPDRLHLTMELTRKTIDLPLLPAGYRAAAVALVVSRNAKVVRKYQSFGTSQLIPIPGPAMRRNSAAGGTEARSAVVGFLIRVDRPKS